VHDDQPPPGTINRGSYGTSQVLIGRTGHVLGNIASRQDRLRGTIHANRNGVHSRDRRDRYAKPASSLDKLTTALQLSSPHGNQRPCHCSGSPDSKSD
jgi:hypothetical protein